MRKILIKLTFLLALSFLMISCGKEVGKTNVKVSLGAISGSANFPGGLYVFGENEKGDNFLLRVPANDELDLELPNGNWNFGAIGWDDDLDDNSVLDTNEYFQGDVYCDGTPSPIKLDGADFFLPLNAKKPIAADSECAEFSASDTIHTSNFDFMPMSFHSCLDIAGYIQDGDPIDPNMICDGSGDSPFYGGHGSFRISVIERDPSGSVLPGVDSECLTNDSISTTKLPFGHPSTISFRYRVKAYSSSNCTGPINKSFVFAQGLGANATANQAKAVANPGNNTVDIFLSANACTGGQLTATPFAASGTGSHLICTPAQLKNVTLSSYSNDSFELGANLDMSTTSSGTFSYVAGQFGGELRGKNYRIHSGDKPLFEEIRSHPTDRMFIYDIRIENFNINFAGAVGGTYGIFANEIYNGNTEDIEISKVRIDDQSSINITGTNNYKVGGFAGRIRSLSGGYIFMRFIKSNADVASSSLGGISSTGGLYGIVSNSGSNNAIALTNNSVGYEDSGTEYPISVSGIYSVGGLVGRGNGIDFRGYSQAFVDLMGREKVGGAIGILSSSATNYNNISGIYTNVQFEPESDPSMDVGGLIGKIHITSSEFFQIRQSVAHIEADHTFVVNNVGGILGMLSSNSFNQVAIHNTRAFMDITLDGEAYGGIIGKTDPVNTGPGMFSNGPPQISYSTAQGMLNRQTVNGINDYRGGLVGYAVDVDSFMNIAQFNIEGNSALGGAYGFAKDSMINNGFLRSLINVRPDSSAGTFVAGAIGKALTSSNLSFPIVALTKIDTNITIPTLQTDCDTTNCGLVIGQMVNGNQTSVMSFFNIAQGTIQDTDSDITDHCGLFGGGNCPTSGSFPHFATTNYSDGTCSSGIALPSDYFAHDGSICRPTFEKQWFEFGHEGNDDISGYYIAGNNLEPFDLNNKNEFDKISDNHLLLQKSYQLQGNLDLSGAFTSIGSETDPFRGGFFSNGNDIVGVNFTASPTQKGVFNAVGSDAILGYPDEQLTVVNPQINCGSESSCGFIGAATNGTNGGGSDLKASIRITDGQYTGLGDCTGGIVGRSEISIRFDATSYHGWVAGAYGVGGIIGCHHDNPMGSESRINIQDTFVDAQLIRGSDDVGGMIGLVDNVNGGGTGEIKIEESYVIIDKNVINGGTDFYATIGSNNAGLIGAIDLATNSGMSFDSVYVDTTTATLPGNFKMMAIATSGAIDGNDNFDDVASLWNPSLTPFPSYYGVVGSNTEIDYILHSHLDLSNETGSSFETSGGGHSDFIYDGVYLRLRGEVEGFGEH